MKTTIDDSWDKVWKNFTGLNIFGQWMFKSKEKAFSKILKIYIPKDFSIVDVGTGSGNVLSIFRKLGYKNSIGIDPSINSISLCEMKGFKKNKDVFLSDSFKWKRKHDVVWSDGLLEHYDYIDMKNVAKSFVKMSKKLIGFTQPNPNSLITKFINKSAWEWERPYKKEDYIRVFESFGCHLIHFSYIHFKEQYFFIFERNEI